MSTVNRNVLLVEDERSWAEVYERAARRSGLDAVRTADSYAAAAAAIDSMRFAVALVDIGLDVDDDRNIDGLRVMEKIRASGDRTSVVVITGRSGGDVLPIVRDAIKKFNAYDTIAKSTLVPSELRTLIEGGLREYELGAGEDRTTLSKALCGDMDQLLWDDMLLGKAVTHGGVTELYKLIDSLFAPLVPLVPTETGGVRLTDGNLACGTFWSRGIGSGVIACFGPPNAVTSAVQGVTADGMLVGRYAVGELVREYSSPVAKGVVYSLIGHKRSDFLS